MDGLSKTLKSFGLLPASISTRAFQPFSPIILLTKLRIARGMEPYDIELNAYIILPHQIKDTMETDKSHGEKASKIMIDKPSDFIFHAAYMAYSKTWDENPSEEARAKLNKIMLSFSEDDPSSFYSQLNEFRKDASSFHGRSKIRSQRKRAWREKEQKKARMSRYRK